MSRLPTPPAKAREARSLSQRQSGFDFYNEIELGKIAVKVLLAAVLVRALHAALEDAEIAFDRVSVDRRIVITDVLASFVVRTAAFSGSTFTLL